MLGRKDRIQARSSECMIILEMPSLLQSKTDLHAVLPVSYQPYNIGECVT